MIIASIPAIISTCSVVSINRKLYLHAGKMHDSDLKSCCVEFAFMPQGYSAQASL